MLIYKIFRATEWAELTNSGATRGAPVDIADGFVHFSTAAQLHVTLRRHFADDRELVLLAVDADSVGDDLRWQPSRGGDLFPHLYRNRTLDDVLWESQIQDGTTGPICPKGLE